jgi:tRNA-Thr(GGU) m(6)t(6)A37 methyltransferase TsaA
MTPIGVIVSPHKERYGTPRQAPIRNEPDQRHVEETRFVLFENRVSRDALRDLDGFDYIWVLFSFHLNHGYKALVTPPRGPRVKRGVFATRAPHRPNNLGLSACRLLRLEENELVLGPTDLLDQTPVFDIKPYLPFADSFPAAKAGWVDQLGSEGEGC